MISKVFCQKEREIYQKESSDKREIFRVKFFEKRERILYEMNDFVFKGKFKVM